MNETPDTPTIPAIVASPALHDVFEVMTRAVFQAGVSWSQIARHWNAYRRAFADFDVERVAAFTPIDVESALEEPGVLRMRRKVEATVKNAQALLALVHEFGDFHRYAQAFPEYAVLAKDIKRRFAFMGEMNAWYLLFRLGEPVPPFETWVQTIPGEHPRMREMVQLARDAGISPER